MERTMAKKATDGLRVATAVGEPHLWWTRQRSRIVTVLLAASLLPAACDTPVQPLQRLNSHDMPPRVKSGDSPATPAPSASLRAYWDEPWPGDFAEVPSKLVGYQVFQKGTVIVSVKRYYWDNQTDRSTSPFPGCPDTDVLAGQVVSRGDRDGRHETPHWRVHRKGDLFGVVVDNAYMPRGEYGTQVECCASGDEFAANRLRPTLYDQPLPKAMFPLRWKLA